MNERTNKIISIDLGCGDRKRIGTIGIDVRKTSSVDILADVRFLPLKDGSIDVLYSSHLLEHFSHSIIRAVLQEWVRVMKSGAILDISCPDLRARALLFFLNPSWNNIKDIYGKQDYPQNFHNVGFSYGLLKGLLESIGIVKIKRIIDGYKGIPFIPNCLHIRGMKT